MKTLIKKEVQAIKSVIASRNIVVLLFSAYLTGSVFGFFYWALSLIVKRVGGIEMVGLLFAMTYILSFFCPLLGGVASDMFGRKRVIVASSLIDLFGVFSLFLAETLNNIALLTVGFLMYEGASTIGSPAIYAIAAESVDEKSIGVCYSILQMSGLAACGIGSLILGFAFEISAVNALAICIILVIGALFSRLFLRETLKTRQKGRKYIEECVRPLKSLRQLSMIHFFLIFLTVLIGVETSIDGPYYSIFMDSVLKIDASTIGLVFALIPISQAMIQPVAGRVTDKLGPLTSIFIGNLVGAICVLFFILSPTKFIAASSLIIASMIGSFHNVGYRTLIAKESEASHKALAFGSLDALSALSSMPFPAVGAVLWQLSTILPFVVSIVLSLIIAMITLIVSLSKRNNKNEKF
ncbi:MAG: MFS transporter [Candidatus Thermoplasmatota archaeon]|nr:MFS transporter [Candidatus Thermoplasmatota archaeon]